MAETTGISWCNSTFNPWIGCTKVGPGCDHCYAEALDKRHRWGGSTHWGAGIERKRTGEAYWRQPLAWNRKAAASGKPWRVFCASLADVFDNEVPLRWRQDLMSLVADTQSLTWLFLTKRIGMARTMLSGASNHRSFFLTTNDEYKPPANLWIGATIVNQEEADRDIPKLLATPAAVRFVSYEPALGPVDWSKYPGIDWIIVGGESVQGAKARAFNIQWARSTIQQSHAIGAAPFVKQLGSHIYDMPTEALSVGVPRLKDRAGADHTEWPHDLRVQEFPTAPARSK